MRTTLVNAVDSLCSNPTLWQALRDILMDTNNEDAILEEGQAVEVQAGDITISFTWDMITAVNNKTNDCIDLMSVKTDIEVLDFFESAINTDLDSCYYCPFVDYPKSTNNKSYCLISKRLYENNHKCHIPTEELRKFALRRK